MQIVRKHSIIFSFVCGGGLHSCFMFAIFLFLYSVQCMKDGLKWVPFEIWDVPEIYSRVPALESIFTSFCYEKRSGFIYVLITKVNKRVVNHLILVLRIDDIKSGQVGILFFFLKKQLMSVCSGRIWTSLKKSSNFPPPVSWLFQFNEASCLFIQSTVAYLGFIKCHTVTRH